MATTAASVAAIDADDNDDDDGHDDVSHALEQIVNNIQWQKITLDCVFSLTGSGINLASKRKLQNIRHEQNTNTATFVALDNNNVDPIAFYVSGFSCRAFSIIT